MHVARVYERLAEAQLLTRDPTAAVVTSSIAIDALTVLPRSEAVLYCLSSAFVTRLWAHHALRCALYCCRLGNAVILIAREQREVIIQLTLVTIRCDSSWPKIGCFTLFLRPFVDTMSCRLGMESFHDFAMTTGCLARPSENRFSFHAHTAVCAVHNVGTMVQLWFGLACLVPEISRTVPSLSVSFPHDHLV